MTNMLSKSNILCMASTFLSGMLVGLTKMALIVTQTLTGIRREAQTIRTVLETQQPRAKKSKQPTQTPTKRRWFCAELSMCAFGWLVASCCCSRPCFLFLDHQNINGFPVTPARRYHTIFCCFGCCRCTSSLLSGTFGSSSRIGEIVLLAQQIRIAGRAFCGCRCALRGALLLLLLCVQLLGYLCQSGTAIQ